MVDHNVFENKVASYYTLGCKLNFAETSTIGKQLAQQGIRRARNGEEPDICVINTCSVTELADKKGRQLIRRLHKQHPNALMVVTGCYAQLKSEEISSIDGVTVVLGNEHKTDILQHLNNPDEGKKVFTTKTKDIRTFIPSCSADDRTRHFLKVQDGCDYFCSFCTIPQARGRSRNGRIAELVKQAEEVASAGGKEIVLTGVNIGDFGKTTGERFFNLLQALDTVEGIERYRISSIEPNLLTDEIIDFAAKSQRFMPHFHLPLQSGSDDVLKLMRRRYDTALFRHRIETIKQVMPDAFIGIDVIVGTRGESEAFFDNCHAFLESIPFSQLHVFSYSERAGTAALKIAEEVPARTKQLRSKRLLDLSDERLHDFYDRHIGTTGEVLFEHAQKGDRMLGFTEHYIKMEAPFDASLTNTIAQVKLEGWNETKTALIGQIISA